MIYVLKILSYIVLGIIPIILIIIDIYAKKKLILKKGIVCGIWIIALISSTFFVVQDSKQMSEVDNKLEAIRIAIGKLDSSLYSNLDIDDAVSTLIKAYESLEEGLKHRIISEVQDSVLVNRLSKLSGLDRVYLAYDVGDLESRNYASQLAEVFKKSGISTWIVKNIEYSPPKGVVLMSKSVKSDGLRDYISKAFTEASIKHRIERGFVDEDFDEEFDINIKIGPN